MKRAVKAVILDSKGYGLIVRRSSTHPYVPFTPDLPGGTIDEGENIVDALAREVSEETGIDINDKNAALFGKKTVTLFGVTAETILYEISGFQNRPKITLDFEHDSFEWVPVKDMTHVGFFEPILKEYIDSRT